MSTTNQKGAANTGVPVNGPLLGEKRFTDTSNTVIPLDGRGSSSPTSRYNSSGFWEHLWRTSGIHSSPSC